MKKPTTRLPLAFFTFFISICLLLLPSAPATAQSWRWAKQGGSSNNSSASAQYENVEDMAVDRNGNIYTISNVTGSNLNVSGTPKQGWGLEDVMLNSFRCDGSLRWSKVIGGSKDDMAYVLRTDSLDGVYAAIKINRYSSSTGTVYVDADATLNGIDNKSFYLLKYDTAGNYQWMVSPEPDTINSSTSWSKSGPIDMEIDGSGIIHLFCQLPPGLYGGSGGYVATALADYMLKYSTAGVFQGAFKPQILLPNSSILSVKMARDPQNGKYYFSGAKGSGTITVGSTSITYPMYMACFDKGGIFLWKRENSSTISGGFSGKPAIDYEGNIYLSGDIWKVDNFNGYVIANNQGGMLPFIVKLDSFGNNVWARHGIVDASSLGTALTLRNSGEVVMLMALPGKLKWAGFKDSISGAGADHPVITRFSRQTGKVLGVDKISCIGGAEHIVSDGRDNIYVGGKFKGSLTAGSATVTGTGGYDDFFVAKYGYDNCTCSSIPAPSFTMTNTAGLNYSFSYTGSTPYSNILWDFGDGITSTQANPVHTYTQPNYYEIAVTVWQDCGDNSYSRTICHQPVSNLSYSKKTDTVAYTYTGSPADSVIWDFGNGKKDTTYGSANKITHIYKTAGIYTVCATAYSRCGNNKKCATVQVTLGVNDITDLTLNDISIYPNPVTDKLTIEGATAGTIISIYDITGRLLQTTTATSNRTELNTVNLASGNYMLQLTSAAGSKKMIKLQK